VSAQVIDIGIVPDDGTGDPLRTAFGKSNANMEVSEIDSTDGTGVYGVLAGLTNGSNQLFTVSRGSYVAGTLQVYWKGALQSGNEVTETNPAIGTLTMSFAPPSGPVMVIYREKIL
jgi:hypothetical protein